MHILFVCVTSRMVPPIWPCASSTNLLSRPTSARDFRLDDVSTPSHSTMQDYQHLLRLLKAPDIREQTRAVFRSLFTHCEDEKRLCSFILESVRARVNDRVQSETDYRRSCGYPPIHLTAGLRFRFESEALNDEARRWMADFLLYRAILRM
ncbi:hypothetical protein FRC20_001312 [Serendipita sp. 405]|nr:hypothetical protein FRC20_001312 [Serendipita sp. 405]